MADQPEPKKVPFDPDFSPDSYQNREAARSHGRTYDPQEQCYRDRDGYMVRDRYGQTY